MVPATSVQSKLALSRCASHSQTEQRGPASSMQATLVQSSVVPATFVQSELVLRGLVLWGVVPQTYVQSELVPGGTV